MTILTFISSRLDEVDAALAQVQDGNDPAGRLGPAAGLKGLKLARVELMREIVAEHESDTFAQICLTCRRRGSDEGWASEAWPCPTVRQVAALWRHHPAYDADWTPQARPHQEEGPTLPRQRRASNGAWLRDASQPRSDSHRTTEPCGPQNPSEH